MSESSGPEVTQVVEEGLGACVYVDALGSSAALAQLASGGLSAYERLAKSVAAAEEMLEALADSSARLVAGCKVVRTYVFSDSTFVFAIAGEDKDTNRPGSRAVIASALTAASHQLNHLLHGRLMRGGLASGYLYLRGNQFLGLPISQAVALESGSALDPCILLSKAAERTLCEEAEKPGESGGDICDVILGEGLFLRDDRDRLVVNPFITLPDSGAADGDEEASMFILKNVRERISSGLQRYELDESIYDKYAYARDLYNYAVSRLPSVGASRILVPACEIERQFQLPFP